MEFSPQMSEAKKLHRIIEESCAGMSLEQYLRQVLKFTKAQIKSMKFRPEGLMVNGQRARVTRVLQAGDVLAVQLEEEKEASAHLVPTEGEIRILYEDSDLIAVWKESGLVVHPSHGHYQDTLSNRLHGYFRKKGEHVTIRSIGRLDRDTSGIVVFAKNQVAAARLWKQKEEGIFWKEYLAVCEKANSEKLGVYLKKANPEELEAHLKKVNQANLETYLKNEKSKEIIGYASASPWHTIDTPIGKLDGDLMKMCVRADGQRAVTHYQIIARWESHILIRVRIDTGRTHQIRVHMASIGMPLVGDVLYNPHDAEQSLQLCAWRTQLRQPFTDEEIRIEATMECRQ